MAFCGVPAIRSEILIEKFIRDSSEFVFLWWWMIQLLQQTGTGISNKLQAVKYHLLAPVLSDTLNITVLIIRNNKIIALLLYDSYI